eukprot:5988503-Prymnesium_polylepis.1
MQWRPADRRVRAVSRVGDVSRSSELGLAELGLASWHCDRACVVDGRAGRQPAKCLIADECAVH